jgi:hypothetical protein
LKKETYIYKNIHQLKAVTRFKTKNAEKRKYWEHGMNHATNKTNQYSEYKLLERGAANFVRKNISQEPAASIFRIEHFSILQAEATGSSKTLLKSHNKSFAYF